MSRIYVFATRYLGQIFGDNIRNCELEVKPEEWNDDSIFHMEWPEQNVKIYGFDCTNWDNHACDIEQRIEQWNRFFRKPDDEIYYILHDKIVGIKQPAFFYKAIDSYTSVYGFQHEESDCIGHVILKFKQLPESVQILNNILIALKIREQLIGQINSKDPVVCNETLDNIELLGIDIQDKNIYALKDSIKRYLDAI